MGQIFHCGSNAVPLPETEQRRVQKNFAYQKMSTQPHFTYQASR